MRQVNVAVCTVWFDWQRFKVALLSFLCSICAKIWDLRGNIGCMSMNWFKILHARNFYKKILIECRKQSIIALIFLFFALWLAQKTCTTTSTKPLQIHTSNDLVERVFPPFGLYVIFTCFWLVIEITLALVLPPYLCSGALDPGSPRLQRNVVSDARPHGNVFHMPKDPDGKKIHYKSQNSYQRNSGLSTVGDKQAQGGGGPL